MGQPLHLVPKPALRIASPVIEDFGYLARRMRPDEVAQWLALTGLPDYNADECARVFAAMRGPSYALIGPDGKPILLGGFEPVRAGVYRAWLLGSMAGWDAHWHAITRICRRLLRDLLAGDAHRVEVYALASREAAHGWYVDGLRMTREGTHPGWFADGQDAVSFAATKRGT